MSNGHWIFLIYELVCISCALIFALSDNKKLGDIVGFLLLATIPPFNGLIVFGSIPKLIDYLNAIDFSKKTYKDLT